MSPVNLNHLTINHSLLPMSLICQHSCATSCKHFMMRLQVLQLLHHLINWGMDQPLLHFWNLLPQLNALLEASSIAKDPQRITLVLSMALVMK